VGRMKLSRIAVALAVLVVVLGAYTPASGAPPATPAIVETSGLAFAMYPADKQLGDFFNPTIDAGKEKTLQVKLVNTGKITFDARALAINASTGANGGFALASAGTKATGVTLWLDFPEAVYTLEPGKGVQLPLTVKVPKGTAPGQYLTALVMETADPQAVEGTSAFKQVIRQALPVFITVPGPVTPKFEVSDVSLTKIENGTGAVITFSINNSGNVLVKPKGAVTVVDSSGATILNAPVDMRPVYARDKTTLSLALPTLASGGYKISVNLRDDATGVTASVSNVSVTFNSDATPVPPPPIFISTATAAPQPSLKKIQFLEVDAKIVNNGDPVANAQLTLHVTRDDQVVEDYSLSSSLALPAGDTTVQSRYIPVTGWKSGTWAFTLTLETVDPANGAGVVVGSSDLGGPIVIP
jgi:hypothetical protein